MNDNQLLENLLTCNDVIMRSYNKKESNYSIIFFRHQDNWIIRYGTSVLRQSQSSTRGCPAGLTLVSTSGPFFMPNRSFPISFMLSSICNLWDIASRTCFSAAIFLGEPWGALRNCQWSAKMKSNTKYNKQNTCLTE